MIDKLVAERVSAAERARKPATLLEHGGDRKSADQVGVINSTPGGTDADYLTARANNLGVIRVTERSAMAEVELITSLLPMIGMVAGIHPMFDGHVPSGGHIATSLAGTAARLSASMSSCPSK